MPSKIPAITKEVFLQAVGCTAVGWYLRNLPSEEPPSPGELLRMTDGMEVQRRARRCFPTGVYAGNVEKTIPLLQDKSDPIIFEAEFRTDGYVARADWLQRVKQGLRLIEFKSNLFKEDKVDADLIDDLAYTTMVLRRAGLKIARAELMLLSADWRLGMPDDKLFVIANHTKAALKRAKEFEPLWAPVRDAVLARRRPEVQLIHGCGKCPYFEDHCLGKGVKDPIFDLPRLSPKRFDELAESGLLSIRDIPESNELTDLQERVRQAVVGGKPVVDAGQLRSLLAAVRWPAVYLDFETVNTALPLWGGVAPHEKVVTQYSIHRCDSPGKVTSHSEYLAQPDRDCREELVERLLADSEGNGSVIHYSSFEKGVINGLAARFPKLAKKLRALADRLFDMERFFSKGYCHPQFRGRTSIKATLPVLIKGMRYDDLAIGDGGDAVAAFVKMARGECSPEQAVRLRGSLLEYCCQDTLAMVKLHETMTKLAG